MSASHAKPGLIGAAKKHEHIHGFGSIGAGDHFVQFYKDEEFLIQSLVSYVAHGFAEGQSVVLILTPEHRAALEKLLFAAGFDLIEYRRRNLYHPYDAAKSLDHFMEGDHPNARRFRATIEPILALAGRHSSSIRAFGEMVALLWGQGKKTAAIELEILWCDLMDHFSFALLCAYPIDCFSGKEINRELRHICRAHKCVIPHETSLSEPPGPDRPELLYQLDY